MGAGTFHTLSCHSHPSLPSRSCCEAFHCPRDLQAKPGLLHPVEGLQVFLRVAGGEESSRRGRSGQRGFPKRPPGCAQKSSRKRRSCHGTRDTPQASSSPRETRAQGRRFLPWQSGRSTPFSVCRVSHPAPLKGVNQGLVLPPHAPTPALPDGLFTGPSLAGGECSLTLTAARGLFRERGPSSNQSLRRTTKRASDALVSTEPLLGFCEAVLNLINNVKSLYRSQKCSF